MESTISKPVTVIREEFISTLADLINNSNLPAFVMEPILKDMHSEVKLAARRQYEFDKKNYEESLSSNMS